MAARLRSALAASPRGGPGAPSCPGHRPCAASRLPKEGPPGRPAIGRVCRLPVRSPFSAAARVTPLSGSGPSAGPAPPPGAMAEQTGLALPQTMDRSCWVCFATDEDDRTAEWVRPCRCRGSTKWVHQTCLQRWVDEKQRGNSTARVACPQCNAEYLIVFPKLGKIWNI